MGEVFQPYGLVLRSNSAIQKFLEVAAFSSSTGSSEILLSAKRYLSSDEVPYTVIRDIWFQMEPSQRPQFSSLLGGVTFVLESPKPREKSKELKERLQRLQEMADRKAYDALVRDVTLKEEDKEYFSSYKDQLGFGLHVIAVMFTGYLVGYMAFRALFGHDSVMSVAGGILGLVSGMLLETILFIVRSSAYEMSSTSRARPRKKSKTRQVSM
uniref:ATPase, vacuolar ER assembly factor, Vma12 n=1 Tax=Araucaria cunninghamii TaxID=56994 RepID=A0A0D6R5B2_ARACU